MHRPEAPAAQRLRFVLDFGYATGLRASELLTARLGDIETDREGNQIAVAQALVKRARQIGEAFAA